LPEFYEALARGKQIEGLILSKIKPKYPKAHIIDGYFKDYDIYIPEKGFGVEVKCDEKSQYTRNLVIEVEFDGKKSALSTTKAEYWVFYTGEEIIWIEPQMIKEIILSYPLVSFCGKGDTKFKKAHLVKKSHIIRKAVLCNPITTPL
tara:strand:+ start:1159 stop:1599 length:441 start_codon:yes stop_codon:yes gene_type:complete